MCLRDLQHAAHDTGSHGRQQIGGMCFLKVIRQGNPGISSIWEREIKPTKNQVQKIYNENEKYNKLQEDAIILLSVIEEGLIAARIYRIALYRTIWNDIVRSVDKCYF